MHTQAHASSDHADDARPMSKHSNNHVDFKRGGSRVLSQSKPAYNDLNIRSGSRLGICTDCVCLASVPNVCLEAQLTPNSTYLYVTCTTYHQIYKSL